MHRCQLQGAGHAVLTEDEPLKPKNKASLFTLNPYNQTIEASYIKMLKSKSKIKFVEL